MSAESKVKQRILVIDKNPVTRQELAQWINGDSGLSVCCEADAAQALDQAGVFYPDLVLIDLSFSDQDGLDLIKDIHAVHPDVRMLVVSIQDEALYAEPVLCAGACGYVMKQEGSEKLLEAIRQVLGGRICVSEQIAARILETLAGGGARRVGSPIEKLTSREFEVFQLIGAGKGTREIAQHLHLSIKTVEVHRAKIKEKLDLKTAADLVRHAAHWTEAQAAKNREITAS